MLQLIRLDRELTGELLLRHPEKFSVSSVVAQLKGRRDLQHWYLGLLFDRSPEMYGAQEYAPFHALQVCVLVVGLAPAGGFVVLGDMSGVTQTLLLL